MQTTTSTKEVHVNYTIGQAFISEVLGTGMLLLLGAGVVANVILPRNKGFNSGWIVITFGWCVAVLAGVYVAFKSGGYLNPAVVLGVWASGAKTLSPGIDANATNVLLYIVAEILGAFLGGVGAFLAYKKHFDEDADPATKLGVFSTGPAIRSYFWNFVTEVFGTFVLVFWVAVSGKPPTRIGPLAVSL
ncbi:MAG: aquaporin family protein, partial [Cellulomonas sp. 14-74-6]